MQFVIYVLIYYNKKMYIKIIDSTLKKWRLYADYRLYTEEEKIIGTCR